MHDNSVLVEERLAREVYERVLPLVHPRVIPLVVEAGSSRHDFAPFTVGSRWGAPWQTTWFRLSGELPADWAGKRVEAIVDLGFELDMPGFQCEGLVRDAAGQPVQGIHPRRTALAVESQAGPMEIVIEAASNPAFPNFVVSQRGRLETAGTDSLYRFRRADLVVVDGEAEALLHDFDVLVGHLHQLDRTSRRRRRLLRTLERALDATERDGVAAGRTALADEFAQPKDARPHHVVAVGHAHIDTAWLWPLRETVRKCIRTFTSAVRMMDADPTYVFTCSQAQQYDWIRRYEPGLFERIKQHVSGGQFVPIGGQWVESDMNLPSGESLVRQIVHGQRFFDEHFGVRCTEMWIPDVFGYPAGLPQLFAAGGMDRFITQKLSWNKTNRFPHSTFWWEGLDGTRVLTHFPPVETYNAEITPEETARSMRTFAEHGWSDWSLVPYGHGDGGGGPTREMVERRRRIDALPDTPAVAPGTAADFFAAVEAEAAAGAPVPVWRGELYFETHRGTLTSQLDTKHGNRRAERLLRQLELLLTQMLVTGPAADSGTDRGGGRGTRIDIDPRQLDELWQQVLTQQFHDIIPGSSIGWVHDDAERILADVAADVETRIAAAVAALGTGPQVLNAATAARHEVALIDGATFDSIVAGDRPALTAARSQARERAAADLARAQLDGAVAEGGVFGAHQRLADGRVAVVLGAPGLACVPLQAAAVPSRPFDGADAVVVTDRSMANGSVAVTWGVDGRITSIIDIIRGRELLRGGARGAQLRLHEDHPVHYDAWDLEQWAVDAGIDIAMDDARVTVEAAGPLVGVVAVQVGFASSAATLRYVLRAGSPRLEIEVDVDWHESERLLSLTMPLDVRTEHANCGVQFGHVARPTHRSTSWDDAKFEVCVHRFVDLSEPSFGVAVLNDGRYGHGVVGGDVRVSLARAARYPDPAADTGRRHRVTLAVLPHGPGLAEVVTEAERLAYPLRPFAGNEGDAAVATPLVTVSGAGIEVDAAAIGGRATAGGETAPAGIAAGDAETAPTVTVTGNGVEVDALKPADDGSGDVIVRLHEAVGDRAPFTIAAPRRIVAATRCNLLEEPYAEGAFEVADGIVAATLRPFELATLRLTLAS